MMKKLNLIYFTNIMLLQIFSDCEIKIINSTLT